MLLCSMLSGVAFSWENFCEHNNTNNKSKFFYCFLKRRLSTCVETPRYSGFVDTLGLKLPECCHTA